MPLSEREKQAEEETNQSGRAQATVFEYSEYSTSTGAD